MDGNHRGGVGKDDPQHREPQGPFLFPSPSLIATVLCTNDVDVLFPVWLLVVPLLLCCFGLRHRMFIALLS